MSRPEELFVAQVLASTGVTDLIGTDIYPVGFPEGGTLPAVIYTMASDNPVNHASGTTTTHETRIEAHLMATTYSGAKALATAMESALSGWADASGHIWHLDSTMDDPGEVKIGQDIREYHGVTQNYLVWN